MTVQNPNKPEGGPERTPQFEIPEIEHEKKPEDVAEAFRPPQKAERAEKKERANGNLKVSATTSTALPAKKDDLTLQIEKVLEEDIEEIYFNLPQDKQKEFKEKGEETASAIRKLFESIKIQTKEIIKLITDWLKIVPGINKFFIEQEAKIKADKILNIKNPK